jgi:hypothetical protein
VQNYVVTAHVHVFRTRRIIWDKPPGTGKNYGTELLYAQDTKADSNVELIISQVDELSAKAIKSMVYYFNVLIRDGSTEKYIDAFDRRRCAAL